MGNAFDSQKILCLAALLAGWCAACGSGSTGSGTGGTGSPQGGSSGGGTGGGGGSALGCAGKTSKLCEDFETGTVGGLPTGWTALDGYGGDAASGVGLANDQFRSGSMSLKSDSMTPGEERIQKSLASLGAT